MAVNYLYLSAFSTAAGLVALQWWTGFSLDGMKRDGFIGGEGGGGPLESAGSDLVLLLSSRVTVALLVNFVINVYILAVLLLKLLFFVQLTASETRKVLERFISYIMYKGTFLPLVVPLKISHVIIWSTWLIFLCSLQIFQSVARDRLERLNASPSMTPLKYFRVYSSLLLVLFADFIWMKLCMVLCTSYSSSLFMLLFFEPLSVAFDTLQAIMIHGFQLTEIYQRHSSGNLSLNFDIQKTTSVVQDLVNHTCGTWLNKEIGEFIYLKEVGPKEVDFEARREGCTGRSRELSAFEGRRLEEENFDGTLRGG